MRSRMSSKFRKIRPWTTELAALERLKKSPLTYNGKECCERSSAFISNGIFFILAGNKDSHKISHEFEIQLVMTMDCGVTCP